MASPSPSSAASSVIDHVSHIEPSVLLDHLQRSYLEIIGENISAHDSEALSKLNEWLKLTESYLGDPTDVTYQPIQNLGKELSQIFADERSGHVYFPEDDVSEGLGDILETLEFPKIFRAYVKGLRVENGYHGGRGQVLKSAEDHLKSMERMERDEKENDKKGPWLSDIDKKRLTHALAMSDVSSVQMEFEAHRNLVSWIYAWQQKQPKVEKGEGDKRKRDEDGSRDEDQSKEKKYKFRRRVLNHPA